MKTRSRRDAAEVLAIEALGHLAGSADELAQFVDAAGMDPQTLRERASDPGILLAVLDFLLADDKRLLDFCEAQGIGPKDVHAARYVLDNGS